MRNILCSEGLFMMSESTIKNKEARTERNDRALELEKIRLTMAIIQQIPPTVDTKQFPEFNKLAIFQSDGVERLVPDISLNTGCEDALPTLLESEARFLLFLERQRICRDGVLRRVIRGVTYTVTSVNEEQMIYPVPTIVEKLDRAETKPPSNSRSWRLFSPELAKRINPEQPDITAAILIYGLTLWQNNRYAQTMINGKRHSFRSLNELLKDHPYFTRTQIEDALNRSEVALKGRFQIVRDREKLYFHVDDYLKKLQKDDKMIGFKKEQAVTFKVVGAVIMQNLEYQLKHFDFPKTDDAGNCYGILRPRELSKHLPFHEDTISRALKQLRTQSDGLVRHPQDGCYYTLSATFHAPKTPQPCAADPDSHAADPDTCAANPDNLLWPNSNESSSSSCKGNIRNPADAAHDRLPESSLAPTSAGLNYLQEFSDQLLQKFRNDQISTFGMKPKVVRVKPSELPYDDVTRTEFDLPYDFIPSRVLDTKFRTRKQWLDDRINDVTLFWRMNDFQYTRKDLDQLRHLFRDNPHLPTDFFEQIHHALNPEGNWMRVGDWSAKKGEYDPMLFLRRIKTAKALLQYLPQIIHQKFRSAEMVDGKMEFTGAIEEPFDSIDYSYLGKIPNSRLVPLDYV